MALTPAGETFRSRVSNPLFFFGWSLVKLPSALFCGVGVAELTESGCRTTVPYGWRSQNPFRSTYFAAQAMAAELSTGALVLLATTDAGVAVSTLIVGLDATFGKKADATTTFACEQGADVFAAVREAVATGEPRTVVLQTVGRLPDGTEVSRFRFTWSVKKKGG